MKTSVRYVRKRDGRLERFAPQKIEAAIGKAIRAVGTANLRLAATLADQVVRRIRATWRGRIPTVEYIQDCVEQVLMQNDLPEVAKAYILYRQKRSEVREIKEFFGVRDDLKLGINAIKVLERRYLLRDKKGNVVETPSQLFRRVARAVAAVEKRYNKKSSAFARGATQKLSFEDRWYEMMVNLEFMPNTPCLMNAGTKIGQLAACFVVDVQDSLDSIFYALTAAGKIHQTGGGTGFDFSPLRAKGALVSSTGGTASGPVSFMTLFDQMTEVIKQGGKRRGASMGILRMDHPDILEFITKKAESPEMLRNFNISVAATDAFMRAVARRDSARQVFDLIVTYAWRVGDPGMIFIDEINRRNPTVHTGRITATNPCGEQPLHPWESCVLGSLNLAKFVKGNPTRGKVDWDKLRVSVHDAVRFLDNMIDASKYPLPEIDKVTKKNRRIGLGVMGFAEALILMGIPYDSKQALTTGGKIMKFIETEGHKASQALGREKGSFPNFKGSLWQKRGVRAMRNATVTTVAPTGTISIIAGCSSGIEPLFAVSFVRNVMEGTRLIEYCAVFEQVAREYGFWDPHLITEVARTGSVQHIKRIPPKIRRLFKTALEIPVEQHVRMQAAFQKYSDNAVSKTINLPESATVEDVRRAYLLAWKLKCKGITIYRYGSKPGQVLTIGPLEKDLMAKHVTADSEFAGGCPAGVCAVS